MALTATISGDCRMLTIAGDSTMSGAQVDIYWNDATITSIPYDPTLFVPITALEAADTIYEVGAVGMCDINCCLGAKTKELIKCKCGDCTECMNIISDITKIFMLMNGAKINVAGCVQTNTLYEASIDEYFKAKTICGTKDCNCDC